MNTITTLLKKQYNEDIQNICNIDKSKSYNIKNHRYTDDHYYNKKQFITNNITNNITKKNTINNTEHILNVKKDFSTKNYISNNYKSQNDYIENNLYKKQDNITFNNTNNITKHFNNYSNDVTNNYKIKKIQNLKETYYNSQHDVCINKHNTNDTNDTYNRIRIIVYIMLLVINILLKRTSIQVISPIILQDITITTMRIM